MIICNLAVLLAERNMKISELSKRTGISRTTLTALTQNHSKGIQFDTFDNICSFLKIGPNELFLHIPFEFNFEVENEFTERKNNTYNYIVYIQAEVISDNEQIKTNFECQVAFTKEIPESNIPAKIKIFPRYSVSMNLIISDLPTIFKTNMLKELSEAIKTAFVLKFDLDEDNLDIDIIA